MDEDDDRTQVQHRTSVPGSSVGAPAPAQNHADGDTHALPNGTRLDEFELTRRIGEGGFSIVYLAWDHSLDRKVAVKEYMPGSLATRVGTTQIRPRSDRHRETFEAGLKSFINEAKLLAQFDHPALVKVYRFWEANGTAYLVMPLYDGVTLKDTVRALPQPPDEAWLIGVLTPLTAALNVIHAEHCYHRDIAPDNVMLLADGGKPLLLDFGAARRVIGDMTQALTVILKPGYAPVEQYAEVPGMKQGPWTDVYALAATVYWSVTGKIPPPSVGRMVSDAYVPLAQAAAGRYSAGFLQAIDRALVVLPEARTQTIAALRRDLGIDGAPRAVPVPPPVDDDKTVIVPLSGVRELRGDRKKTEPATPRDDVPMAPPRTTSATSATDATTTSRRGLVLGAVAAGVVVIAATAWWAMRPPPVAQKTAEKAPVFEATPASASASASASAPAPTTTAVEPEKPIGITAAETTGSPAALLPPPAPPPADEPLASPVKPKPTAGAIFTAKPAHETGSKADVAARNAECAQIYQRLSLGETRPDLLERANTLKCR
jgi:serine/threonine protein kinase